MRTSLAVPLAALGNALPAVAAIGPLRRRLWPELAGFGRHGHIAVTFDDGPDPQTTPGVLAELAEFDIRATFFVLGSQLAAYPHLGRRIVAEGHEIAMHGWSHGRHLLRGPVDVASDLGRCHGYINALAGRPPAYWRPPHGVLTATALAAAFRLDLRPVLWSADGREWRTNSGPADIAERLRRTVRDGGTALLHDADVAAPSGTAREVMRALPSLVAHCERQGWTLGPLRDHGLR